MRKSCLSSQKLSIGYKAKRGSSSSLLYSDLAFDLYSGELTCLLGANGTGKSTLLKTLNSSLVPLSGEVLLFEKNIREYSENDLSKNLGLVLTEKIDAGGLLVKEIVGLGRYPYTGFWGKTTERDEQIIEQAMEAVSITHKANSYISELSDGERQKALIAKALAQECPIILLDEPTAFLDATSRIEIMLLLQRLAKEQNKAIMLSTHDIELALSMADRLWLLSDEKGLRCGLTEDLVFSDTINEYLGSENIRFDSTSGSFHSVKNYERAIKVHSEQNDEKWVRNFLARHRYAFADANTPLNLIEYELQITAQKEILLKKLSDNQEFKVNSFDQLSTLLGT